MRSLKRVLLTAVVMFGLGSATANAAGQLYLYNWSNYIPPDLLKRFEKETGINVTLDTYASNEKMLAKLQAGATGYDVVVPSGYMVRTMIAQGLAEEIDTSKMPNFKNVAKPHDDPPFDPGRKYSAPYMWGTTGLAYDSARAPQLEDSWKEFFEPRDELKGQVVALNDAPDVWNAAAHYLGIDKCTESSEDADRILKVLEKQKPDLAMYSSSGTIDRMVAGEVIMHQMWNGAVHRAKAKRASIKYIYPKEGLDVWGDNFVVPKGAPDLENAKTFINWMMDPKNAAEASNYTGYMNAISGSDQYLDDSLKNDPAVNMPAEFTDRLRPTKDCSKTARELRDKVWTRLKK